MSKERPQITPRDRLLLCLKHYGSMREIIIAVIDDYHRAIKDVGRAIRQCENEEVIDGVSIRDWVLYRLSRIEQEPIFNESIALSYLEEALQVSHKEYCGIINSIEEKIRNTRIEELATMPYQEYLRTPEWQERRQHILERDGHRCRLCNASNVVFNVHHKTYERRGFEDDSDLITLCRDCHSLFHENSSLADEG